MRALLLLTLLGACAPAFTLPLPERFVALEDQEKNQPSYRLRATTPDGVVLAVRTMWWGRPGASSPPAMSRAWPRPWRSCASIPKIARSSAIRPRSAHVRPLLSR